jgi:hypothetical protein
MRASETVTQVYTSVSVAPGMLAAQSTFAFAFASERCMLVVIHLNKVIGAENLQ